MRISRGVREAAIPGVNGVADGVAIAAFDAAEGVAEGVADGVASHRLGVAPAAGVLAHLAGV